ncbi:HK97 family phage prohead protease [Clostridium frigidicarnis]|uniref:Prohead serine protease domain-containing protein n=1 Tax=Clostridium frigidicarnis TaxID=84698 RepID=A0A1I0V292_9CLOT|nr:HK97 family phage prohead protease [Clostridium frigidicarnis]SFA70253.1 prohead peptidase. Unknown type peptidase. MEROPS family U35 [Clostridium frigidicarnis]
MDKREFRNIEQYEIREVTEDQNVVIEGYIAKFDSVTELWEGYYEKIDRGAFDDTLKDGHNIFLLYHHDWTKPLASTKTGTLELNADNLGLRFKATVNNKLSYARDTIELVRQGLIQGCSFGFCSIKEDFDFDTEKNIMTRTLLKVELYEGSVLCIPQYDDTTVFTRAKELATEERKKIEKENELKELNIDLQLLEIENSIL